MKKKDRVYDQQQQELENCCFILFKKKVNNTIIRGKQNLVNWGSNIMNSSTVADSVETHDHLDELRYQEEVKTLTTWSVELFGVAIKLGLHASI